jgi:hypothetical protein
MKFVAVAGLCICLVLAHDSALGDEMQHSKKRFVVKSGSVSPERLWSAKKPFYQAGDGQLECEHGNKELRQQRQQLRQQQQRQQQQQQQLQR